MTEYQSSGSYAVTWKLLSFIFWQVSFQPHQSPELVPYIVFQQIRGSKARELIVNKVKGGNISHLAQFNAVKVNSGTAPFWSYTTPESTYLLGYALASFSTPKNTFSCSIVHSQLGFHLDPFHIREKEVQTTCIQSSLKTLKWKNMRGWSQQRIIFWPKYSLHTSLPQGRCSAWKNFSIEIMGVLVKWDTRKENCTWSWEMLGNSIKKWLLLPHH